MQDKKLRLKRIEEKKHKLTAQDMKEVKGCKILKISKSGKKAHTGAPYYSMNNKDLVSELHFHFFFLFIYTVFMFAF